MPLGINSVSSLSTITTTSSSLFGIDPPKKASKDFIHPTNKKFAGHIGDGDYIEYSISNISYYNKTGALQWNVIIPPSSTIYGVDFDAVNNKYIFIQFDYFLKQYLVKNITTGGSVSQVGSDQARSVLNITETYTGFHSSTAPTTSTYLSVPFSTDFQMGSGNFTIDAWIYGHPTSFATRMVIVDLGFSGSAVSYFYLSGTFGNELVMGSYNLGSAPITQNAWNHVAFVRSGTSLKGYINGVVCSAPKTASLAVGYANQTLIGGTVSATYPWRHPISNVRISKGIARWTSNFTPPAIPVPSDANTGLLIRGDEIANPSNGSTFTDSGNTGHNITVVGSTIYNILAEYNYNGFYYNDTFLLTNNSDVGIITSKFNTITGVLTSESRDQAYNSNIDLSFEFQTADETARFTDIISQGNRFNYFSILKNGNIGTIRTNILKPNLFFNKGIVVNYDGSSNTYLVFDRIDFDRYISDCADHLGL